MRTPTLLIIALLLFILQPAKSQWVQTNGPHGGFVNALVLKGTYIFAGVEGTTPFSDTYRGGLYRSTDNGVTWKPTALMNAGIGGLAVKGERLLAVSFSGWGSEHLIASTDDGMTWAKADSGLPSSGYFTRLAAFGDYVYVGGSTVYRSLDGGTFWTPADSGLPKASSNSFAANGGHLFVATNLGVYRSVDSGTSWVWASSGLTNTPVYSVLVATDGHLYAGTARGVFSSSDDGTNWTGASPGMPDTNVFALAVNGTSLFAAAEGYGVYRSTDSGQNWTLTSTGLPPLDVSAILVGGPVMFAGTGGAGIFRSSDNGTTWTASSSGLPRVSVQSLAMSHEEGGYTHLFAATSGGIYCSADHGVTWIPANAGLNDRSTCVAVDETLLFAGTYQGRVYRSTNLGASWARADSGIPIVPSGRSVECFAKDPNGPLRRALFASLRYVGVFRSFDSGISWTQAGLAGLNVWALAIIDSNLIAGTSVGVYRSTDCGSSWSQVSMRDTLVYSLGSPGSSLYAGTRWGIFLSRDYGSSWIPAKVWSPRQVSVRAFAFIGGATIAGTHGHGAFLSLDGGLSWTETNTGLGNGSPPSEAMYIRSLAAIGPDLFAGTYDGVWRLGLDLAAREDRPSMPGRFVLGQNYPNPFNPSTTIKYELPKSAEVRLSVFDMLGREVSVLVNERRDAGVHEVKFEGSNLATGVYFYRLQAGDFVQTRKLLLAR